MTERPILFELEGQRLLGIVHEPPEPATTTGVLIVVGGPQYRIGAHRQFVHLARHLAAHGIPVMRFDYRGIGDSEGNFRGFEGIAPDIEAALKAFQQAVPELQSVVLWGLCDAASAILMHGNRHTDPAIVGAVVANPWVRTEAGEAKTYLRHYYTRRLFSREMWRKIWKGEFRIGQSLRGIAGFVSRSRYEQEDDLPDRVIAGINAASLPILLILSGRDLVAQEFEDTIGTDALNRLEQSHMTLARLADADHTFSKAAWKTAVADTTLAWIRDHFGAAPIPQPDQLSSSEA